MNLDIDALGQWTLDVLRAPNGAAVALLVALMASWRQSTQQLEKERREEARKLSASLMAACDELWDRTRARQAIMASLSQHVSGELEKDDFVEMLEQAAVDNLNDIARARMDARAAINQIKISLPALEAASQRLLVECQIPALDEGTRDLEEFERAYLQASTHYIAKAREILDHRRG